MPTDNPSTNIFYSHYNNQSLPSFFFVNTPFLWNSIPYHIQIVLHFTLHFVVFLLCNSYLFISINVQTQICIEYCHTCITVLLLFVGVLRICCNCKLVLVCVCVCACVRACVCVCVCVCVLCVGNMVTGFMPSIYTCLLTKMDGLRDN